jgi:hypothetical protein
MNATHRLHVLCALLLASACAETDPAPETITPWPLTVETALLSCSPTPIPEGVEGAAADTIRRHGGRVFVTIADGRRFAVNGTAQSMALPIEEIQAQPDLRPLIQRGLALCERSRIGGSVRIQASEEIAAREAVVAAPSASVSGREIGAGHIYTIQADEAVGGARPTLSLSCAGGGQAPMIMLDIVSPPRTAPPLRGVFGRFLSPNGADQRFELSWATGSDWTLRSSPRRDEDRILARQIITDRVILFESDASYLTSAPLHFDFNRFAPEDWLQLTRECGWAHDLPQLHRNWAMVRQALPIRDPLGEMCRELAPVSGPRCGGNFAVFGSARAYLR